MDLTISSFARPAVRRGLELLEAFLADEMNLLRMEAVASLLAERLGRGQKVLACGNGGSATQALHFAEELTGRFRSDRPPLPAIACQEPGHITGTANDYGFAHVFSRWVEALGRPGDVLVVLSTSGNSENLLRAVEAASRGGLTTIALLGGDGGRLRGLSAHEWVVPDFRCDRVQEIHLLVLHCVVEGLERSLFPHLWDGGGLAGED